MIFAAWKRVAGESLQKHTQPTRLDEKRLVILVGDEIWKRHLESLSGQMIFKLNSMLGSEAVTFMDFQVDNHAFQPIRDEKERLAREKQDFETQAKAEITPRMQMAADEIKDERLRDLFLQAAGNCLVRKKHLYS
jgi:hypothetical protein